MYSCYTGQSKKQKENNSKSHKAHKGQNKPYTPYKNISSSYNFKQNASNVSKQLSKSSRNNYSFNNQYYNIAPSTSKSNPKSYYKGFKSTKEIKQKCKGIRVQVNLLKQVTNKIPLPNNGVKQPTKKENKENFVPNS